MNKVCMSLFHGNVTMNYMDQDGQLDEYGENIGSGLTLEYDIRPLHNDLDIRPIHNDLVGENIRADFEDLDLKTHRITPDFIRNILKKKKTITFAPGQEKYIPPIMHSRALYCDGGDSLEHVMLRHMKTMLRPHRNTNQHLEFKHLMRMLFETDTLCNFDGKLYPCLLFHHASFDGLTFLNGMDYIIKKINTKWYVQEYLREHVALQVWGWKLLPRRGRGDEDEIQPYAFYTLDSSNDIKDGTWGGGMSSDLKKHLEEWPTLLLNNKYVYRVCGCPEGDGLGRFDCKKYNQLFENTLSENNLEPHMEVSDKHYIEF